jgi:hypothetical protein
MNPFATFPNQPKPDPLHSMLELGTNYVVELSKNSTDLYRFTSYPTLNPNFWAKSLDFSGVAAHLDARSATLIGESGQFATTATHWAKSIGETHTFVAETGEVVVKTIIDRRSGPGVGAGERDVTILKFAESDTILNKYKLPNPSWNLRTRLANKPALVYTQSNRVSAKIWRDRQPFNTIAEFNTRALNILPSRYPSNSPDDPIFINNTNLSTGPNEGPNTVFPNHEVTILSGDSGKPIFLVLGDELILMSGFAGFGSGPYYGHPLHVQNISNMVTAMGGSSEQLFHSGF